MNLAHSSGNFLKNCLITFFLGMKLPEDGTNELSKDGFDWITLKVIFQGPKGPGRVKFGCLANFLKNGHFQGRKCQIWPIFHNYWYMYYSVVTKCVQMYCIMYLLWWETNPILKYERCGICSRSERSTLDFCDLFGLISQKPYVLWPMLQWNTYPKSYKIVQFTLRPLNWKGGMTFTINDI